LLAGAWTRLRQCRGVEHNENWMRGVSRQMPEEKSGQIVELGQARRTAKTNAMFSQSTQTAAGSS
jgi:hypothetical protein